MELISAYADGELTEHDMNRVKLHISACESCSALLDIYRELSIAVDESCAPAPDALRAGVMEKVLNGGAAEAPGDAKNRKPFRLVLIRYAPIAACLAIILLAVPWIVNSPNWSGFDSAPRSPASVMNDSLPDGTVGGNMAVEESFNEIWGGDMPENEDSGDTLAPAPQAAPLPEAAPPAAEPESAQDNNSRSTNSGAGESASQFSSTAPTTDTSNMPSDPSETEKDESDGQIDLADSDMDFIATDDSTSMLLPDVAPEPTLAPNLPSGTPEEIQPGAPPEYTEMEVPGDVLNLLGDFSDAYAWIEITGELPKLLNTYDPEPLDGWLNWDVYYEIPIDAARKLINEISGRKGVSVTYNFNGGDYAIVLYSPQ